MGATLSITSAFALFFPAESEEDMDTCSDIRVAMSNYEFVHMVRKKEAPVVVGSKGDGLVKIPESPEMVAFVSKYKDSVFVSIENPVQYIEDGYCLINVVPYELQQELGRNKGVDCRYRLFCGDVDDMTKNNMYAVEFCEILPSVKPVCDDHGCVY